MLHAAHIVAVEYFSYLLQESSYNPNLQPEDHSHMTQGQKKAANQNMFHFPLSLQHAEISLSCHLPLKTVDTLTHGSHCRYKGSSDIPEGGKNNKWSRCPFGRGQKNSCQATPLGIVPFQGKAFSTALRVGSFPFKKQSSALKITEKEGAGGRKNFRRWLQSHPPPELPHASPAEKER